ncbi:hypothetical protein WS9_015305 [Paraclostridium sordellii 8483]|uniref:hypothetical protein n=1 Tax=Paraclostridium sordellii TaxID=1505 RepID=UPI00030DF86C|nr:hypothetical protein [Paeniclostridium sordellii]TAN63845.1 hypothetical protein WS9_015305 [Paeniclostridium sordellii 8483]
MSKAEDLNKVKKEASITSVKETFFKPSDYKIYPNYMALAQCICGIEINGEVKYPKSIDKVISSWGLKNNH